MKFSKETKELLGNTVPGCHAVGPGNRRGIITFGKQNGKWWERRDKFQTAEGAKKKAQDNPNEFKLINKELIGVGVWKAKAVLNGSRPGNETKNLKVWEEGSNVVKRGIAGGRERSIPRDDVSDGFLPRAIVLKVFENQAKLGAEVSQEGNVGSTVPKGIGNIFADNTR